MYLRKVTRKNKNGTSVDYYQLAHNERDPISKKSVARIIHNFGRADQLDREALVRLCQSIARVCGLKVVDNPEGAEHDAAEHSCCQLMVGKKKPQANSETAKLPDTVKFIKTVEYGTVAVVKFLWEKLGIGDTLRSMKQKQGVQLQLTYEQAR